MKTEKEARIVILGISDNVERYSYMAYQNLLDNGYRNLAGITPKDISLMDIEIKSSLKDIKEQVHTLTLYVGANRLDGMIEDILALRPKRIICNPGTENQGLIKKAQALGIEVIEGCTLVMLRTDQF